MSVREGSELQVIPPDVISLNTVLDALTKAGQLQRALKVLREGSVAPDQISYRTVLTGLAKAKDWDASVDLLAELLRSHAGAYGGGSASGDGGVAGIERGTYGIASLASQLPPVQRELKLIEALRERGLPVDGQCYLLAAYACKAAANATAAMALLDAHEAEPSSERQPQEAFYAAVIAACGAARAWDLQWEAFQRAQTAAWARGLRMSTVSVTNILHSAAKSGRVRQARGLIRDLLRPASAEDPTAGATFGIGGHVQNRHASTEFVLPMRRDVALYCAALECCEMGGDWRSAIGLLDRMLSGPVEERVAPDVGCFTAAMTAVAAAGEVEAGMRLLHRMRAKADYLTVSASYPVHRILLEACRRADNDHLAAEVEALIFDSALVPLAAEADLAPKRRRPHATGRTTYANHCEHDRTSVLQARVRELCATLRRHAAYEPRYEALPPAFLRKSTSDQLDRSLHSHAEKKALVDLLDRGCERLELSINFHVCLDCHAFMRSAARHLRRPIVVREPRMVHHFGADGVCSCGEGWRWEARTAARASSPMAAPLALGSRLDS